MFEDVAKKTKYLVYSKKYDRECRIGELIDRETIERLNTHFDFHGYEDEASVKAGLEWSGSIESRDGLQVSLLVDLSGSMQGRPIAQTCYAVLAAAQALESVGASVEVLGHTTAATNRPSEEFETDRTITDPGRLSEALFVVAKEPGVPADRASGQILAMAANSPDLRHENLDGEALVWAARRLVARPARNRLLVLVTDSFEPHCRASERAASDLTFMKRHLKAVVEEIDASDELDFVQVIAGCHAYHARQQDTYRAPVAVERAEAGDIARAIGEAVKQVLAPEPKARAAAAPTI